MLNVISLFSGCGGMDIGFEGGFTCLSRSINTALHPDWASEIAGPWTVTAPTGFQTVFANDIRPDARAAWASYFGTKRPDARDVYHLGSIVDLVKQSREGESVFPLNADVVTGGFPCQDYSVSGKRNGFNSHRSHTGGLLEPGSPSIESRGQLYMWMRDVVTVVQPNLFVAENVKGLANMKGAKAIIEEDFSQAGGGYLVVPAKVLHAADFGVPQSRERVIFFGFRRSALTQDALDALTSDIIPPVYDPYPIPTHSFTSDAPLLAPPVTCREAFVGLPEPDAAAEPAQKVFSKAKYMGRHCQGQAEIRLDAIAPTIRSEHHGNIEFRRLSREHGGLLDTELNKGFIERRLTVRECARIQTFPDNYQFILPKEGSSSAVSATSAYQIIGNAVPCVLAYNIAMRIRENWELYFGSI